MQEQEIREIEEKADMYYDSLADFGGRVPCLPEELEAAYREEEGELPF